MNKSNYPWRETPIYFVAIVDGKAIPNAFNSDAVKYCEVSNYPIVKNGLTFDEAELFCSEFNIKEMEK